MRITGDLHALTDEQVVQLRRDLTLVEERLQDIAILMRVCYGEESQAVIRNSRFIAATKMGVGKNEAPGASSERLNTAG